MHGSEGISPWVARWSHLIGDGTSVLDVACGAGRHTQHFLRKKCRVTGMDIAQNALDLIVNNLSTDERQRCRLIQADIEGGPWPFGDPPQEQFAALIVTNYLWRPLLPVLFASVAPTGVLIYETFCAGNESVGKPSRPDFLLQPGELLAIAQRSGLRTIAYEDGFLTAPDRFAQRIVAVAPQSPVSNVERTPAAIQRYAL